MPNIAVTLTAWRQTAATCLRRFVLRECGSMAVTFGLTALFFQVGGLDLG